METKGPIELRYSAAGNVLFSMYRIRRLRRYCMSAVLRLEGDDFYSGNVRRILESFHGVKVGAYSYGECMIPGAFPAGVEVGRYVSIAGGVRVFLRNHPVDNLSMHPFFYNKHLGYLKEDAISTGTLVIGHDAWIGERAIFLPNCRKVGIGSVIGAGSVVTKDVPDFAIVAGNPAKVLRSRFAPEVCDRIRESRWWLKPVWEIVPYMEDMIRPLPKETSIHPLLRYPETKGTL